MEFKKKIITISLMMLTVSLVNAQIIENGERKGLLQATASIYPSQQLNTKGLNIYLGGYANYHFDDKYSFRGDVFQYISSQKKPGYIMGNTQVLAGFMRYFPVKRWDPFVGVQAGVSFIKLAERPAEITLNSVFALKTGVNYHVWHYFYFFLEFQYSHQPDPFHARPFDQFTGTGGLGFQIPCKKK